MGLGHWELLLAVFIILLLFGGKKLPEFAKGLGKGLQEFRKSIKEPVSEENDNKLETKDKEDST